MFIRSTGLGRTLLSAKVSKIMVTNIVPSTLEPPPEGQTEPRRLLMELEITHPVHWTVRAFVEPPDLKEMVKILMKNPSLLWEGIKFLFSKTKEKGMEVEGVSQPVPEMVLSSGGSLASQSGGPTRKGPPPIPPRR
ncbi:MAG: hypothetical protein QXQ64_08830 [Candidatus Bathyarchaeia archaeon]